MKALKVLIAVAPILIAVWLIWLLSTLGIHSYAVSGMLLLTGGILSIAVVGYITENK